MSLVLASEPPLSTTSSLLRRFVYRARRPFSPLRLWETVRNRLVVIQDSYEAMLEGMDISHEDDSDSGNGSMDIDEGDSKSVDFEAQPQLDPVGRLASKQACPAFGPLLRSKGFLWLASRPRISGEWSQAGVRPSVLANGEIADRSPRSCSPLAEDRDGCARWMRTCGLTTTSEAFFAVLCPQAHQLRNSQDAKKDEGRL